MTTSGTSTFNYTRDQIIRRALRQCGAIASGETPDAQTVTDAADALNAMVKEWNTIGIHVWAESEGILFLQAEQAQYSVGPSATDQATQTNPPNFAQTTLSAAAANGATSISVTSSTNITISDNIGVLLDDGSLFWTTVSNKVSTTITLASGLTDSAASGNTVFDYTTKILRPLRISDMRRYNILSAIETPMVRMARLDYRDLPNKANTGTPTSFFYDPLGGAVTYGLIYIWPIPVAVVDTVKFTWLRQIQDFNAASDTPDLPQEWINALVWNLSVQLAPEFDVPPPRFQILSAMAAQSLDRVTGWDREPESTYFGVSMDYPQGR